MVTYVGLDAMVLCAFWYHQRLEGRVLHVNLSVVSGCLLCQSKAECKEQILGSNRLSCWNSVTFGKLYPQCSIPAGKLNLKKEDFPENYLVPLSFVGQIYWKREIWHLWSQPLETLVTRYSKFLLIVGAKEMLIWGRKLNGCNFTMNRSIYITKCYSNAQRPHSY